MPEDAPFALSAQSLVFASHGRRRGSYVELAASPQYDVGMDWFLERGDLAGVSALRREFHDYAERHSADGSDVDGAVLTFTELVGNAVEHGDGPVWVSVDWLSRLPTLAVHDLGTGFTWTDTSMPDPSQRRGRGLAIAADLAAGLEVAAKSGGGTVVEAQLDLPRADQVDLDPPRRTVNVLPDMSEAGPEGFERESFLRALVVQLAQGVEHSAGPLAAETSIAQVGTDVGSQMETEYRLATGNAERRLDGAEMAEAYVRLKAAIGGDFYVLEASEDRIVLGNRRCPFGEAVQKSPALCRMTSSVFGGIAARNAGEATVVLEERIAVGDPECRVVVLLGPGHDAPHGHRYLAPED